MSIVGTLRVCSVANARDRQTAGVRQSGLNSKAVFAICGGADFILIIVDLNCIKLSNGTYEEET